MSKSTFISRSVAVSIVCVVLLGTLLEGCKSVGDAPNRRIARRVAIKQAVTGTSVFKTNRLSDGTVDTAAAAVTPGTEPFPVEDSQAGDIVTDDGGFIPTSAETSGIPGKPGDKSGKTSGKDGKPSETATGKIDPCAKGSNSPSQSSLKSGDCSTPSNTTATTPVTPNPTTTFPTPTSTTTETSPTATTTNDGTTPVDPGTIRDPAPTQAQTPPKESCNMFVHLRGHKPEWTAVFIPAQAIPANQKDEVIFGIANLRMPNCNWPTQRSCVKGAYTYSLDTNGQPGSTDCQAVYSMNYSPLIIDMVGQGIALTHPSNGVKFDIEGTGEKLAISWPVDTANTPFLVLDVNNNGNIDSVHELFGNNTKGPDGKTAANGFLSLAKYDQNRDRIINPKDAVWTKLRLWRDLNRDGSADASELSPLTLNRLVSIDLDYVDKQENGDAFGNSTLQRSVVEMRSGRMRNIFDLWFVPGMTNP